MKFGKGDGVIVPKFLTFNGNQQICFGKPLFAQSIDKIRQSINAGDIFRFNIFGMFQVFVQNLYGVYAKILLFLVSRTKYGRAFLNLSEIVVFESPHIIRIHRLHL